MRVYELDLIEIDEFVVVMHTIDVVPTIVGETLNWVCVHIPVNDDTTQWMEEMFISESSEALEFYIRELDE